MAPAQARAIAASWSQERIEMEVEEIEEIEYVKEVKEAEDLDPFRLRADSAAGTQRVRSESAKQGKTAKTPSSTSSGSFTSQVMLLARQGLNCVAGIAAAVPGQESARDVAVHRVELAAKNLAAEFQAFLGIAQRRKEGLGKTVFAGDLSHDLHESPTEAARVGFRGRDLVVGIERRDVFGEKSGLVTHRPGIPGGFLFDHGADQSGIERVTGRGFAGKGNELGGSRHGPSHRHFLAATALPSGAVHVEEAHHGRQAERDALMRGDPVERVV